MTKSGRGVTNPTNRLADEQSPYLFQHRHNPVDWYPWSDEAFEKARREDKPIFLSIGYSTCHWCHVMERESFEDEQVAALMNESYVAIKVDREERPDIDGVYMTACQMMTGQGGWPLSVVMTPDGRPFHVSTYIPKQTRFGRMGLLDLLPRVADVWRRRRDEIYQVADEVTWALRASATSAGGKAGSTNLELDEAVLDEAFEALRANYDTRFGGFGAAPKFPPCTHLFLLLRYWKRTGKPEALEMVEHTLERMRLGGMYDHVGFGFHRYATDHAWRLPHFEKMLVDQALLGVIYTEAWQASGRMTWRRTAEQIFEYVLRDMESGAGGFHSAEDADSDGREGLFYLWTVQEVCERLPKEDADWFVDRFQLSEAGNFEEEATGLRTGLNVLHLPVSLGDEDADLARFESVRQRLFEARAERVRPLCDDKVLTDWNGLMIGALSKASAAFGNDAYAEAARRAADFVLQRLRDDRGRLLHRFRNGDAAVLGMIDDYAHFIFGLIELYQATFEIVYLRAAVALQRDQIDRFLDEDGGGFFATAHDAEVLLVRSKEWHDGAMPSANAISALNMLRLARLTGDSELEGRAAGIFGAAASAGVERLPAAFTGLLAALDFALGPTTEVVIAESDGADDLGAYLRVVRTSFQPRQVVLLRPADEGDAWELVRTVPFVAPLTAREGRTTGYVCHDFRCSEPVFDPGALRDALDEPSASGRREPHRSAGVPRLPGVLGDTSATDP